MMDAKIIRTEDQYHAYLKEVGDLIVRSEVLTADEQNRMEVLTVLIESYENGKCPVEPTDPIDAILFRMEERGLKRADLIPYFGTSSRVSEVLNRKRPLTVQMIRALSLGLGISADTLVGLNEVAPVKKEIDWSKFPIKEMVSRGWMDRLTSKSIGLAESVIKDYIAGSGLQIGAASFRRSLAGDATSPTTVYALYAWLARVIQKARVSKNNINAFDPSKINSGFLRELAQLSWSERGPLLAVEYLQNHGIVVVFEGHLKGTQVDGAALKDVDGTPIIALTLRYDRLDNFWFTLLHEVAHVWKHLDGDEEAFVDDLNVSSEDRREAEANRLAGEAFIPRLIWRRSDAYISPSKESINNLARELKIHPAIVAGRLRKDTGNFSVFSDMLGSGEVKNMFVSELEDAV
ncbi:MULTISPECIES: ImmA/IrrE family metallo-endopeptidase [Acetobacteraceae]|mgnify:CR=1 FL=1|nr:ImmA/IrrE family metallo-endopeptidase [Acetobacter persici]